LDEVGGLKMKKCKKDIVTLLYDPRDGKYVKSDNPALQFADIILREVDLNPFQWFLIGQMADHYDERVVAI
jgi:hypothetical protein